MRSAILLLAAALCASAAFAATEVKFYAPNIVRVTKTADGRPYAPPVDVVRMKPAADAAAKSPLKVESDATGAVTFSL